MTEQALAAGVQLKAGTEIKEISLLGEVVTCEGKTIKHHKLINVAGPWAQNLTRGGGISLQHQLDLVRGSHIMLRDNCKQAWLLEAPGERRIFFCYHGTAKRL